MASVTEEISEQVVEERMAALGKEAPCPRCGNRTLRCDRQVCDGMHGAAVSCARCGFSEEFDPLFGDCYSPRAALESACDGWHSLVRHRLAESQRDGF